jgi:hypothetical protein
VDWLGLFSAVCRRLFTSLSPLSILWLAPPLGLLQQPITAQLRGFAPSGPSLPGARDRVFPDCRAGIPSLVRVVLTRVYAATRFLPSLIPPSLCLGVILQLVNYVSHHVYIQCLGRSSLLVMCLI